MRVASLNVNWSNTFVPDVLVDDVRRYDLTFLHEVKASFYDELVKRLDDHHVIRKSNDFFTSVALVRRSRGCKFRIRAHCIQVYIGGVIVSGIHFPADIRVVEKKARLADVMRQTPDPGIVIGDPNCTARGVCFSETVDDRFSEIRNRSCPTLDLNCQRKPMYDRAWSTFACEISSHKCEFSDHSMQVVSCDEITQQN